MNPKKVGGFVLASLFYVQAGLGLIAMGVMTKNERPIVADAGYGVSQQVAQR